MFLATGRRPLSMSKGGMWPECGSDCRDGGEGVTDQRAWSREERKEGVCTEGSRVSLKQMEVSVWLVI